MKLSHLKNTEVWLASFKNISKTHLQSQNADDILFFLNSITITC